MEPFRPPEPEAASYEPASRMASGEMMIKMDGFTPKRVRECFQKMEKENVFPRKCEENLKDLSASLRQVFIGKETGNGCFRAGDFEDAENAYTAGINAATAEYSKVMDTGMSEKKARVVTPGVSILLCNRSLMKSKLGDYQGALDDANEAIRAAPSSCGLTTRSAPACESLTTLDS